MKVAELGATKESLALTTDELEKVISKNISLEKKLEREVEEKNFLLNKHAEETTKLTERLVDKEAEAVEVRDLKKTLDVIRAENLRLTGERIKWVDYQEIWAGELEERELINKELKEKLSKKVEYIQELQNKLRDYEKEFGSTKNTRRRRGGTRR
eukprot:TRINITY_DN7111_c0_g1_i10.p1 TRINITY_DN7111_c0_g1~~TRINITY_DN7111_c0_g1_i10.p1  ORF type:complete len:155 (-),score=45.66 TRINITY_DN7111_c0_g1_i10:37-501(-)